MIRKRNILLFIIVILTAIVVSVNLGAFKKYVILGSWKGEAVSENGNSVKTDWSKVQFSFKWNGDYSYLNSSEYLENGKYHLENNMLITSPRNENSGINRSVEIIQLRINSLILRMNNNGNEIILQLKRL